MTSPAERYASFRRSQVGPALTEFQAGYAFGLDAFQRTACEALEAGRGVLVAAPTGAGKTVVGEFAVHLALRSGGKCFYTTPIKALSNQKYADLKARHGADKVGLLTGDSAINGDADVVVMTTEVLRNMIYSGSPALDGLSHVVMDEVHYLADRSRGGVWEEVIIHLPEQVQVTSLSATVSNAEEFADWLVTVRGDTEVVVEEHRPVPLWQHILVGNRLYDLFLDPEQQQVNPELVRLSRDETRFAPARGRSGRPAPRRQNTSRPEVLQRLHREGLLPAITFIFSRAGCAAAVEQCLRSGLQLNSTEEREQVLRHVEKRTEAIPRGDLKVLGYWEWLDGLERGLAAHHAGMLPTFKEIVEELFLAGLVKAVFATETLALGINMPARSVVMEKLVKWNGESHADVTPGEYTQLTGRAGRRGIDIEGHAVVLWQPGMDPKQVAGLASTRTYPLRSSFRPSYNMAVNLVGAVGREAARALLESSFAQFQADRSVVGLARQIAKNVDGLAGYAESLSCHLGDAKEYFSLRDQLKARELELAREGSLNRRLATTQSMERLRIGDVVRVQQGRRSGLAVVLDPGLQPGGDPHPLVVSEDRWAGRLSPADFPVAVEPVGRIRVPRNLNHRLPQHRKDLATALHGLQVGQAPRNRRGRAAAADDPVLAGLRVALRRHPVHGCDDREAHLRWSERHASLRRDTDALERKVEGKTSSIARTFDRVAAVLARLGYLEPGAEPEVTDAGRQLARVYSESDLLVVEGLRRGLWDALTGPELAAVIAALVYESRRAEEVGKPVPAGAVQRALTAAELLWAELAEEEARQRVSFLRRPDSGFSWAVWRWAGGATLEEVLAQDPDLTAGDFVRWCKQLADLLGQLADIAPEGSPVGRTARQALAAVRRGVVAYSSVL